MKVTFLGATRTVTGSNFLVEGAGKKFLVDCGMYQGKATDELKNEEDFAFDVKSIDFMLLTHAHIDHSGRIPKLYNEGYRNPIYAHKATCDLCGIMLPDSGHIQEMEVEWKNRKRARKGEPELPPLYTAEDATKCLEVFVPVKYDEIIEIDENIHVRYNDAGHMLGSSIIEVWIKEDEKEEKIVVVLSSDKMGEGDDELGKVLIKGFIYAITQLDKLPKSVLLYNGGVKLSTEGSDSIEDLKELEEKGVEILSCGTCLNFYNLQDKLKVGKVTNMYSIVEEMSGATNIIRP